MPVWIILLFTARLVTSGCIDHNVGKLPMFAFLFYVINNWKLFNKLSSILNSLMLEIIEQRFIKKAPADLQLFISRRGGAASGGGR